MKKALIFLTSFLTLLVSFAHPSDAPLAALAEEATKETIYDYSFFNQDFNSSTVLRCFPEAEFYKPLKDSESEVDKLNYALSSTQVTRFGGSGRDHPIKDKPNKIVEIPGVNVETSQDIIYTFVDQITDPVFEQNSTKDLTFINVDGVNYKDAYGSFPENYNVALYYQQAKPSIYFNKFTGKEISFYIEPNFSAQALKDLIKQYDLTGTLVFLQIDNDPILKLEIENNDFKVVASEGVSIAFECHRVVAPPSQLQFPLIRVTMPYRSSISNIVGLRMAVIEEKDDIATYTLPETMVFTFHEDMATNTFFYFFNVKSLSIANKTLAIEETSYTDFRASSSEKIDKSKMSASLVSMQLYYSGAIRAKQSEIDYGDTALKSTQLSSSGAKIFIISMPETKTYNATFTRQSETSGNWLYTLDEEIPMTSSGQMMIYSITFHPIVDGTVREDLTFTQDYTKTELFKYSFDLKKSARIYYYDCVSYYCMFTRNEKLNETEQVVSLIPLVSAGFWIYKGISNGIKNGRQNWQTFAFSFYFDDDKTEPIPNVKKITLKWQCGFEYPNPEPDSEGFYSGFQNDANKKIHIETKEVNNNRLPNGTYALDDDGMFLSDKDSCHKAYTNNKKYDYAIAKLHKRGDKTYNSYISKMAPLEIYYETSERDLVRMVGNSQGLHVVQDEDGNDIVVNSEGIAPTDEIYGVFVANDGSKLPGQDKNGDGKITEDEVINSDTGEFVNYADPNDKSTINKIEDFINDLANNIKNAVSKPKTWLWTILIILVGATIALSILKPSTLISILKSIKSFFSSLFSGVKDQVAKRKSKPKKEKKKSTKSKRKKK